MIAVKEILADIGIRIVRTEGGKEFLCECPWCGKPKLYVNINSGLWECKRGCGRGNPYKLIHTLTAKPPAEIMQYLEGKGFQIGLTRAEYEKQKQDTPKRKLALRGKDLRVMHLLEQLLFCHAKRIDRNCFENIGAYMHVRNPWVMLPAFSPDNLDKACGWLRAGVDGRLIRLGEEREEKYPAVAGSTHGLFCLRWIERENPTQIVFTEAWRDMLAVQSQGYHAVASSGGASCWRDEWLPVFKDRDVILCFDADKAGQKACQRALTAIANVAKTVRIATLPYKVESSHGKDLYDYLVNDGKSFEGLLVGAKAIDIPAANVDEAFKVLDDSPESFAEGFMAYQAKQGKTFKCQVDRWFVCKDEKYINLHDNTILIEARRYMKRCYVPDKNGIFQKYKCSDHAIREMLIALAAMVDVTMLPQTQSPVWFIPGMPDPRNIIVCNNIMFDLNGDTIKTMPLTKDLFTLQYRDFDYKEPNEHSDADDYKVLLDFLAETFTVRKENGELDVEEMENLISLFQEIGGYCMVNDCKHHVGFAFVGPTRSGKSTACNLIASVSGKGSVTSMSLSAFGRHFGMACALDKQLIVLNEAESQLKSQDSTLAVANLKQFLANEEVNISIKHKADVVRRLNCKLLLCSNSQLRLPDHSGAMANRFIYLLFQNSVLGKADPDLMEKLLKNKSVILKFFMEGYMRLKKRGYFILPRTSRELLEDAEDSNSSIKAFLREKYDVTINKDDYVEWNGFYKDYCDWCQDAGMMALSKIRLRSELKVVYPQIEKKQKRVSYGDKPYVLCGIRSKIQVEGF